MPMGQACCLCPHLLAVPPRMERYSQESRRVMAILHRFSPSVQQISIDEAFLDMRHLPPLRSATGSGALLKDGEAEPASSSRWASGATPHRQDGERLRQTGRALPRLSLKHLAFIDAVGLKKLWGVGKVTHGPSRGGIKTTADLGWDEERLKRRFGNSMTLLYLAVRGEDPESSARRPRADRSPPRPPSPTTSQARNSSTRCCSP